jgi:outer membrane protein OmpA-like peptidoglycan-associated protein
MSTGTKAALVVLALLVAGGGSYVVNQTLHHIDQLNSQISSLEESLTKTTEAADAATQRAEVSEQSARESERSRVLAEDDAEVARQAAANAGQRATLADDRAAAAEEASTEARATAQAAQERADEIRRVAETEMNRLTEALGRIAETRRTALGLVMSLDEGYLKFDFDKADLRPESRELLSRIAGILYTAEDFTITVSGHTDARGAEEYNQQLSERRAQAVADYLIAAGLSPELFTVQGLGQTQLIDDGTNPEAHAKNRRVELGMVNARIVQPSAFDQLQNP